jgi:hypothetical protein
MSISQKEKISKSQKAKGLNEKRIFGLKKARQKLINEGKYYKEVGKYDCSGTLIESFNSISDASSKTGLAHSTISRVCAGKPH